MEDRLVAYKIFWIGAFIIICIGAVASLFYGKADFLMWLAYHRNTFLDYFFYYITKAGEPIGYFVVGLIFLVSSWKKMLLIPVLGMLVTLLTYLMKSYFYHERPALFLKRMNWLGPTDVLDYHMLIGHTSFPSGHSMAAWALCTLTATMFRNTWVSLACLFVAVSVSLSRIYLMAHFLEDVVFGAGVGCLIGYGVQYGYERWIRKGQLKPTQP